MTNSDLLRSDSDNATKARTTLIIFVLLFVAAFVLRVLLADSVATGDELNTIQSSQSPGINQNGYPYFVLTSIWMRISNDLLWLRLPAIILGSLAVSMCYLWLRLWRSEFVAVGAALLFIVAPSAIFFSQWIRFYSLFLFASQFLFWAYSRLALNRVPRTRWSVGLLVLAVFLQIISVWLGSVVVGLVILHWAVSNPRRVPRWLWMLIATGLIAIILAVISALVAPNILGSLYSNVFCYLCDTPGYQGPRGWSLVIAAKVAVLYLDFALGRYVYPLALGIVVPGLLLATVLGVSGIYKLIKEQSKFALYFILLGLLGVGVIYMIFDPLLPTSFLASASPKLVVWTLPIFVWLLVEGIERFQNRIFRYSIFAAWLVVQGIALWTYSRPNWNYTDYPGVLSHTASLADYGSDAAILADGRAQAFLGYNLRTSSDLLSLWEYSGTPDDILEMADSYRIVAIASEDPAEALRCRYDQALERLASYNEIDSFVSYPFFFYVYDLESALPPGIVALPRTLYHPVLKDLRLPQSVTWQAQEYEIGGAYVLPDCDGERAWTNARVEENSTEAILLFSNTIGNSRIEDGTIIARLTVRTEDGTEHTSDIRQGYETQLWKEARCIEGCQAIHTWNKLVHLTGFSSYADANNPFDAHIWGIELPLPESVNVQSLHIEVIETDASLNIWGLHLLATAN